MEFNDLLLKAGLAPSEVIVMRHRPKPPKLRAALPWLAPEDHTVYNAYQQSQGPRVEKAMQRAQYLGSFIGRVPGEALFIALYRVRGWTTLSKQQRLKNRGHSDLIRKFGLQDDGRDALWFDLVKTDFYADWQGKLVIRWPGKELSWWRWAAKNEFGVQYIAEESILAPKMPQWDQLTLNWSQLGILPRRWRDKLSLWRGIYLILDESDGKCYVGAAYGNDNLLGRWLSYSKSGHGGNKELKGRDPEGFRFSILQILPHDMEEKEVQGIENSWKERLHTREFGLNAN